MKITIPGSRGNVSQEDVQAAKARMERAEGEGRDYDATVESLSQFTVPELNDFATVLAASVAFSNGNSDHALAILGDVDASRAGDLLGTFLFVGAMVAGVSGPAHRLYAELLEALYRNDDVAMDHEVGRGIGMAIEIGATQFSQLRIGPVDFEKVLEGLRRLQGGEVPGRPDGL